MSDVEDTGKQGVSLWSSQLELLGLTNDDAVASAAETKTEAAFQSSLQLPPLMLTASAAGRPRASSTLRSPSRGASRDARARLSASRAQWRLPIAFAAAAAAVALLLWARPFASDPSGLGGLRVKGSSQVWVWWEREGLAHQWSDGDTLESGDRVRVELLAPEDGVAYWAVVDGQSKPLLEPSLVWESALPVRAGVRAAFPGSFRLVGEPEGETLVVFICAGGGLERAVLDAVIARGGDPLGDDTWPAACGHQRFRLR
jgi:hypothetical protein